MTAAATLTLIYAKYDKNFRQQLSTYLPFINSLLGDEQKRIEANLFEESLLQKRPAQPLKTTVVETPLPKVMQPVIETKPTEAVDPEPVKDVLEEKEIKKEISLTFERAINEDNAIVCFHL